MNRWTSWVLRHPAIVTVAWLAVTLAGGALAPSTIDRLSYEFTLPGQPAYEANVAIAEQYGTGGSVDPLLLVVELPEGESVDDPAVTEELGAAFERAAQATPGGRVASYVDTGDEAFVSDDGKWTFALVYPEVARGPDPYVSTLPALEAALADATVAGAPVVITGTSVLSEDGAGGDRGVLVETILGGLGALVVLALVFGSVLALVPLLVATVAILGTFLCLLALTYALDVVFVVQYLAALIGLGVAIDYSLLIVMRWREERSHGVENADAVRKAMATAGRSVIFSGITVAVSLAALIAIPLPFLRSIGLGGLLIPVLSVAVSISLVPVILQKLGPRLQWPRRKPTDPRSRRWAAIATTVVRHRVVVAIGTTIFMLLLVAPVLGLRLGSADLETYGTDSPAGAAAQGLFDAGVAPGALRPIEVLTPTVEGDRALDRTIEELAEVDGVARTVAPEGTGWRAGETALVQVWTEHDPASAAGVATVAAVRDAAATISGVQVGGSLAEESDLRSAVYGSMPIVLLLIIIVTFFLLARALRSVWLPIKALALNVISIGAAFGLTVLIWQEGYGSQLLFGSEPAGAVTVWVPVAVFAFLFGLSMDYEVFILSRMREAYDELGSTPRAVVEGIAYTGRLVTSAALILFLAFVALSTIPSVDVKILATALALGIAIDALVVRTVLAPALVALFDQWNWWLPRWLERLLRVPAS